MDDDQDLNKSGDPSEGEDGFADSQQQPPFAPNNEPLKVESDSSDDPGEEATRIGKELDSLDVEGDETPQPDVPKDDEETNPAEPGKSSLPEIPEIADEGRAPFGAETPGPGLPERGETASFTPDFEELDNTQSAMERFGNDVERFNAAGGADNSIPNIDDDDGGGEGDAQQQLDDSDFGFKSKVSDMLIEQARRIDELTRGLESERL